MPAFCRPRLIEDGGNQRDDDRHESKRDHPVAVALIPHCQRDTERKERSDGYENQQQTGTLRIAATRFAEYRLLAAHVGSMPRFDHTESPRILTNSAEEIDSSVARQASVAVIDWWTGMIGPRPSARARQHDATAFSCPLS